MPLIKVGIFGTVHTGKSTIAEFYTELTKRDDKGKLPPYVPTVGLRILEIEKKLTDASGAQTDVSLQLWDTSGDPTNEGMYNRIAEQLDALIIVVPATELNVTAYVRRLYEIITPNTKFAGSTGTTFIHVFIQYFDKITGGDIILDDQNLASIPVFKTSLDTDPDGVQKAITELVQRCAAVKVSADNDLLLIN